MESLKLALILVPGTLVMYVGFVRLRTTEILQRRLVRLAELLYAEAEEANQQSSPVLLKLHNLMIETAALAPGIAGGVVVPSADSEMSEDERRELIGFLERNVWIFPYLMSMSFIVARLLFHGHPLDFRYAKSAVFANIAMKLCLDREGRTKIFLDPMRTKQEVERVARLETECNDRDNRLVPA